MLFFSLVIAFSLYVTDYKALSFTTSFVGVAIYSYSLIKVRFGDVVQLDLLFLLFLFLYSVMLPLSNYLSPSPSLNAELIDESYLICLVSLIGYAFGSILFGYNRHYQKNTIINSSSAHQIDERRLKKVGYAVFLLGLVFSILAVEATVGFTRYLSAGYAGRALIKREAGPIELGLYVAIVGVIVIYCSVLLSPKASFNDRFVIYVFIVVFFAYVSFLGVRRPTFLLILSLFCCYSLLKRNINVVALMLIFVPVFLFFTTFAQYRQVISSDGFLFAIDYILENISPEWFDFSDTELGAPIKTLYHTLTIESISYKFGLSYLSSFFYVLPSFINGGMWSLSVEYTHQFFSSEFISIGGNMGFFPVTEAYVNFGVLGNFFVFTFFAIFLGWLNQNLYKKMNISPFWVVFCAILAPWFAFFMRLDFSSFMKGFLYSQLVPLFLCWFLYRYRFVIR